MSTEISGADPGIEGVKRGGRVFIFPAPILHAHVY